MSMANLISHFLIIIWSLFWLLWDGYIEPFWKSILFTSITSIKYFVHKFTIIICVVLEDEQTSQIENIWL